MDAFWATLGGAWEIFLYSLIFGVGLPAIFSVGILSHAWGQGAIRGREVLTSKPRQALGRTGLVLCLAIVGVGLLVGLAVIVSSGLGMEIEFNGLMPTFTKG